MKFFTCLTLILFSSYAMACSCMFVPMSAKKLMESQLAIEGKIIDKKVVAEPGSEAAPDESHYGGYYKYTVSIAEVINGNYKGKTLTIYSHTQGATCGVNLSLNETYYLYAYGSGGNYSTGLCSDNRMKKSVSKRYKQIIKQFKKDKHNMKWKDEQCMLVGEGKIVKKSPVGDWKFYHSDESQSLQSEGSFKNGMKEGEWREYHSKEQSVYMWKDLSEEQKASVKNRENILYKIAQYKDGQQIDSKYLFN